MRVAIIGSKIFDTIEYNFWETFNAMDHEAKIFDHKDVLPSCGIGNVRLLINEVITRKYGFARWVYNKLFKKIVNYSPDLVVVFYRNVIPEFIEDLKYYRNDMPIIHVNPDHVCTLGRQYILLSPYDAYFTKEPYWAETMRNKLNLNAYYLPESFNPRLHRKPDQSKEACEEQSGVDIVVAASLYPYRIRFLEQLFQKINRDLNIRILGAKVPWAKTGLWKCHQGKSVFGKEKAKAFYEAKIVINNMSFAEYKGVNCRFFEVLGSGGFMLCDDKPTLKELAVPDKEVVTFSSINEAAEKIQYYLEHPVERLEIARAGYERAVKNHTYEKRIETIFSILGLG